VGVAFKCNTMPKTQFFLPLSKPASASSRSQAAQSAIMELSHSASEANQPVMGDVPSQSVGSKYVPVASAEYLYGREAHTSYLSAPSSK